MSNELPCANHDNNEGRGFIESIIDCGQDYSLIEIELEPTDTSRNPSGTSLINTGKGIDEAIRHAHAHLSCKNINRKEKVDPDEVVPAGEELSFTPDEFDVEFVQNLVRANSEAVVIQEQIEQAGPDEIERNKIHRRIEVQETVLECMIWFNTHRKEFEAWADHNKVTVQVILLAITVIVGAAIS